MDPSKYIEWLKLSPRYLFPISLTSGILIFSPEYIIDSFGLTVFIEQFRPYIGVVFILSTSLTITSWLIEISSWIKELWNRRKRIKYLRERLHNLTPGEKELLLRFIDNQTRSQRLRIDSGVVNGLESSNIIYKSSRFGDIHSWSYNILPWVWDYLNQNPELLSMNNEKKST